MRASRRMRRLRRGSGRVAVRDHRALDTRCWNVTGNLLGHLFPHPKGAVVKLYLLPLLALACSPAPVPVPPDPVPPPPPVEDAGADVEQEGGGSDLLVTECLDAQETICRLGCKTPTGIPLCTAEADGVTFAARCVQERRKDVPWFASCIATITDCRQLPEASTGALCTDGGAP